MAQKEENQTFKQQFEALGNLPKFFRLIWKTSPSLAFANVVLRLLKAAIPLAVLYVGKEIIDEKFAFFREHFDEILRLIEIGDQQMSYLWLMLGLELGLAVLSEIMNRLIALLDSLLGDLVANETSVELIRHAARLDLFQFEHPAFYDKLERARRQTTGRTVLMSQVLTQMQNIIPFYSWERA